MSRPNLVIDQEFFNDVCGRRYLSDDSKLTPADKDYMFELLLRKSDIVEEIESYIDNYIEYLIDFGFVDEFRKELAEGRRDNDAYEAYRQKQIEGEA